MARSHFLTYLGEWRTMAADGVGHDQLEFSPEYSVYSEDTPSLHYWTAQPIGSFAISHFPRANRNSIGSGSQGKLGGVRDQALSPIQSK